MLLYLFCDKSLQYLPSSVHSSQILGEVCFVTALSLHILTADLQHWLVDKVHSQLLTGQINAEALRNIKQDIIRLRWGGEKLQRAEGLWETFWCITYLGFLQIDQRSTISGDFDVGRGLGIVPYTSAGSSGLPRSLQLPWSYPGLRLWCSPWARSSSSALWWRAVMPASPFAAEGTNSQNTASSTMSCQY